MQDRIVKYQAKACNLYSFVILVSVMPTENIFCCIYHTRRRCLIQRFFSYYNFQVSEPPHAPSLPIWFVWICELMLPFLLVHNDVLMCMLCAYSYCVLFHQCMISLSPYLPFGFCSLVLFYSGSSFYLWVHYLHASGNVLTKTLFLYNSYFIHTHTRSNVTHHN
jgi:hypothetical protein